MRLPDHDVIEIVEKFSGSKRRLEVMWNDTSRNDEEPFRVRLYRQKLRIPHPVLALSEGEESPRPEPFYIWVEGDHTWPDFKNDTARRASHDALTWLELFDH